MKYIDADYYGLRDEDDGIIVPLEIEAEKKGKMVKLLQLTKETYTNQSF